MLMMAAVVSMQMDIGCDRWLVVVKVFKIESVLSSRKKHRDMESGVCRKVNFFLALINLVKIRAYRILRCLKRILDLISWLIILLQTSPSTAAYAQQLILTFD